MENLYEIYKGPALSPTKENEEAWEETRNELIKPLDGVFETLFKLGEHMTDQGEALKTFVFGDEFAEKHCKDLDRQAEESAKDGRLKAAEHFKKRELSFAMWTLGYDHEVTTRIRSEFRQREPKTDCPFGQPRQDYYQYTTPYTPPSPRFDFNPPKR